MGRQWCPSLTSVCSSDAASSREEGPGRVLASVPLMLDPDLPGMGGSSTNEDQNGALRLSPWGCGWLWVPGTDFVGCLHVGWGGPPLLAPLFLPHQRERPVQSCCCCCEDALESRPPFMKFGCRVPCHMPRLLGGRIRQTVSVTCSPCCSLGDTR